MSFTLLRAVAFSACFGTLTSAQTLLIEDDPILGGGGASFIDLNGRALIYQIGQGGSFYISDGTVAGTIPLQDSETPTNPAWVQVFQGKAYYSGFRVGAGTELCVTDGTVSGTRLLVDLDPGVNSSAPNYLFAGRDALYMSATVASVGRELMISDGTAEGTALLKDINPVGDSDPRGFFQYGDLVLFSAVDADGEELWKSDGTEAGTVKLMDINPGPASSEPWGFYEWNGLVYFNAGDGVHGDEVWRTDGTEAGTLMINNVSPDPFGSNPSSFTEFNGELFFRGAIAGSNYHLVKTDGTLDGHEFIWASLGGAPAGNLVVSGDSLIFMAEFGTAKRALWRSDGTPVGTEEYFEFNSFWTMDYLYPAGSGGTFMTRANEMSVAGGVGEVGAEVWTTDGTAAGTQLVFDVLPGPEFGKPERFQRVGNKMFMSAFHNWSVWSFEVATDLDEYVAETIGSGCAGTGGVIPAIAATAPPRVGQVFGVELSDALPNAGAIFLFALGNDYLGLGPADCALIVESPFAQVVLGTGPTGELNIPLFAPPSLTGLRILFQYGVTDAGGAAGGISLTPGLEVVLGA